MDVALEAQPAVCQSKSRFFQGNKTSLLNKSVREACEQQSRSRPDYSKFRIERSDPLRSRDRAAMSMAWLSRSRRSLVCQLVNRSSPFDQEEGEIARRPRCHRGLVFYFSFGQRGLRACAQKTGFSIDKRDPPRRIQRKRAGFCLIFGIHRQIRILPIAEDAEPFELFALDVDELPRKRFRSFANLERERPRDSFTTLYSMGRP